MPTQRQSSWTFLSIVQSTDHNRQLVPRWRVQIPAEKQAIYNEVSKTKLSSIWPHAAINVAAAHSLRVDMQPPRRAVEVYYTGIRPNGQHLVSRLCLSLRRKVSESNFQCQFNFLHWKPINHASDLSPAPSSLETSCQRWLNVFGCWDRKMAFSRHLTGKEAAERVDRADCALASTDRMTLKTRDHEVTWWLPGSTGCKVIVNLSRAAMSLSAMTAKTVFHYFVWRLLYFRF